MKDGLLERIRSVGHWRVNFKPLSAPKNRLLLGQCREMVEKASVSARGWDFPHISRHNDDTGGYINEDGFVENWTDWHGFNEFWRMYSSTQFLALVALREDTMPAEHGNPKRRILLTTGTVYQITEIVEFCHRLFKNNLYKDGLYLLLSLINTKGRILAAGPHRVPFIDAKETKAEQIAINIQADPLQIAEDHRSLAIDICLQLFDRFGWNPDATQLQAEQDKFYRQDWR